MSPTWSIAVLASCSIISYFWIQICPEPDEYIAADHGYDNQWMIMKSIFYAQGPYFRKNYKAASLESVWVNYLYQKGK